MRRLLKYLLIVAVSCAIVFVLFSCRSGKTLSASRDNSSAAPGTGESGDARFARLYVDGCAERLKGNLEDALKLFQECATIYPENAAVHYELGTIYKLLGTNDLALSNSKFAAESEPKNEWYQLLYIECLNASRQYAQAIKVRESLVKNFPEKTDFREDLAIEYALTGQYDKSYRIYDDLEKTYGINEQITMNKVKLLKSQKKLREAEYELQRLSDSNKKETRYYAYLAEFYLEQNEREKAKLMYDKILSVDPDNPTVNLALHDYYTVKGQDEEAYACLKKAISNPDLETATKASIIGSFYSRAENNGAKAKEQGLELSQLMLKVHPKSPEANALTGDFLMLDKKVSEALPFYYTAALNERRDPRIWDNLLFVDNELRRFDSLEKHSGVAIELFPSQPRIYLYNGLANAELKNYNKAIQSLEDGLQFVVDDKALRTDFLRLLGDAYHSVQKYDKSDKSFEEALKLNSDNPYVLNNYAYYLSVRNQDLDRAEKLSKRANELSPGNRNYMDTYGWILYQQKKYAEAETWLSEAAKKGPKNPTILEHYGDVLFRLNRVKEALSEWNAAKQAGGSSPQLNRKISEKKLDEQ